MLSVNLERGLSGKNIFEVLVLKREDGFDRCYIKKKLFFLDIIWIIYDFFKTNFAKIW